MGVNLCSLIVIVWFLKMIVSCWVKNAVIFCFSIWDGFPTCFFHFLGISCHAKIETGGDRSEQKNML